MQGLEFWALGRAFLVLKFRILKACLGFDSGLRGGGQDSKVGLNGGDWKMRALSATIPILAACRLCRGDAQPTLGLGL